MVQARCARSLKRHNLPELMQEGRNSDQETPLELPMPGPVPILANYICGQGCDTDLGKKEQLTAPFPPSPACHQEAAVERR